MSERHRSTAPLHSADPTETITLPTGFVTALAAGQSQLDVVAAATTWLPSMLGLDSGRASIALPNDRDRLTLISASAEVLLVDVPIENSFAGHAFLTHEVVVIDDYAQSDRFESAPLLAGGLRSAVVVPMLVGDRCIGTVHIASPEPGAFDDQLVARATIITELVASFTATHRRAETDALTACLSRSAILDRLHHALDKDCAVSLLYVDVDRFKSINDRYGHATGDAVLHTVSARARQALDGRGSFGRLGGDEFLAVIEDDPGGQLAKHLAHTVAQACAAPLADSPTSVAPMVSIGVASTSSATGSADQLLNDADQAMYAAKRSSLGVAVADDATRAQVVLRKVVDRDLDLSLEACSGVRVHRPTFHLQPVRDLTTGEILGAEALLRWEHPDAGRLPTDLILRRIEATGRINDFTRWSLQTAARQVVALRDAVPWFHDKALSVNLTAMQLSASGLIDRFLSVMTEHDLRVEDLIIEVVESSVIELGEAAELALQQLGAAGAVIALDDFGTGHNALVYFSRFPIHAIKFDRDLVREAPSNERARKVLEGMAQTCRNLGIATLAEGVETQAEADLCRTVGIPHGQGWLLGHPLPLDGFIDVVRLAGPPER